MITGAIGIFLVVIGIILSSNGDWGSAAVAWVLAAIAVFAGVASREDDRAHNNFVRYWADGEDPGKRRKKEKRETEAEKLERRRKEDREREHDGVVRISGVATSGTVTDTGSTTETCSVCGGVMREKNRVKYSSGTVYVTYECSKCKHTMPKKIA